MDLFDFFVNRVLALEFAVFLQLNSRRCVTAVLGRHVTRDAGLAALTACGAFQDDLNTNIGFCHLSRSPPPWGNSRGSCDKRNEMSTE